MFESADSELEHTYGVVGFRLQGAFVSHLRHFEASSLTPLSALTRNLSFRVQSMKYACAFTPYLDTCLTRV